MAQYGTLLHMNAIWYKSPALSWEDAIPVGNGRLGARIFGGSSCEKIVLNEESVWSGSYSDRNNKNAKAAVSAVRTLLNQGRETEAQKEVFECFTGSPANQHSYKPAGEIAIDFYDAEHQGLSEPESGNRNAFSSFDLYRREIDFSSGICSARFSVESSAPSTADFSQGTTGSSITFSRECFVSASSDVLVFHVSASTPKSIFLRAHIKTGCSAKEYVLTDDTVAALDVSGIPYAVMMTAAASGGTVFTRGDNLIVEQADEVTLYIDAETAYRRRYYRNKCGNTFRRPLSEAARCADIALRKICFASGTSYENVRADHIAEFSSWNSQGILCDDTFESEGKSFEELSEDKRAAKLAQWNYAKYKLISSCKDRASLPSVKNGIWSRAEKNGVRFSLQDKSIYRFSAGMFGLSRMNLPLFSLAKRLYRHGKVTAERMYGCQGFAAHNATDIWGDSAPCGADLRSSYSPLGALELAEAAVDCYEYSLDKRFLKKQFYLIKEACNFFTDYLLPVEEKKFLALNPSFTGGYKIRNGETAYVACESASDSAALRRLFKLALKALKYLGAKNSDRLFIKYASILQRIKESKAEEKKTEAAPDDFDSVLAGIADGIVSSAVTDEGRVEIAVLSNVPPELPDGMLRRISLKGNILADVEWKGGAFKNARLYTERGTAFFKDVTICYDGKKYSSQLSDGSLDIRNVLPTTV